MSVLKSLMGGSQVVGFYPNLARALGGAKAGLFFCQLAFWMADAKEVHRCEAEFEAATALTVNEQAGARQILLAKNAISIERRGAPPRLFYHINWGVVEALVLALGINSLKSGIKPENQDSIPEIPELSIPRDPEKKSNREKSNTARRIPDDFSLSPELLEYALKQKIGAEEVPIIFDHFKDWHQRKGDRWLRWDMCFQKWCRDTKARRDQERVTRQPELPDWSLPNA